MKMGSVSTLLYFSIAPSAIGITDIVTTGFNLWTIPKGFPPSPVGMADFKRLKIGRPCGTLVDYDFHLPMG